LQRSRTQGRTEETRRRAAYASRIQTNGNGGILEMKATGIVRRVDDLGRIVIPKEVRRQLGISEGIPMELFMENGKVIFQKYNTSECVMERIKELQNAIHEDEAMFGNEKVRKAEEHIKALKEIFKDETHAD